MSLTDGTQHPYDFGKEPKKFKTTGLSLPATDWIRLRDYAARTRRSVSSLLREWLEPHLAEIRNDPLPAPTETD